MQCQCGFLSQDVLLNVVEPPSEEAMDNAMQRLQDVGALDEEEVRERERERVCACTHACVCVCVCFACVSMCVCV